MNRNKSNQGQKRSRRSRSRWKGKTAKRFNAIVWRSASASSLLSLSLPPSLYPPSFFNYSLPLPTPNPHFAVITKKKHAQQARRNGRPKKLKNCKRKKTYFVNIRHFCEKERMKIIRFVVANHSVYILLYEMLFRSFVFLFHSPPPLSPVCLSSFLFVFVFRFD